MSELSFGNNPFLPIVSKIYHSLLNILGQLQEAEPLGHSIRCDSVPFSKLFSGETITDQFIIQLNRIDQRVTE